jgi:hypothetical protein
MRRRAGRRAALRRPDARPPPGVAQRLRGTPGVGGPGDDIGDRGAECCDHRLCHEWRGRSGDKHRPTAGLGQQRAHLVDPGRAQAPHHAREPPRVAPCEDLREMADKAHPREVHLGIERGKRGPGGEEPVVAARMDAPVGRGLRPGAGDLDQPQPGRPRPHERWPIREHCVDPCMTAAEIGNAKPAYPFKRRGIGHFGLRIARPVVSCIRARVHQPSGRRSADGDRHIQLLPIAFAIRHQVSRCACG